MADPARSASRPRGLQSYLPNSAWLPLLITLIGVVIFVGVRFAWATQSDASRFALAGDTFSNPAKVPSNFHVEPGTGYDGQFFYRLGLDPLNVSRTAHGITLDQPIRRQRIAYPFLAFLVSGGSSGAVPWALILVNSAGLAALAGLGGIAAKASGRHAIWGLWFPLFFGFVFTLSRDLSEITEAALLLGGLLAFRSSQWLWAALLLAGAVLARETAVVVVVALAACRIFELVRRQKRFGPADTAWLVPGAAFAGWQTYCLASTGSLPATGGAAGNGFALPFQQLISASSDWFSHLRSGAGLVHLLEVVAILMVTVMALLALRSTTAPMHERVALVLLVTVALITKIGTNLWKEQDDFRQLADLYVVAGLVLLGSRAKLFVPCALVTTAAATTAALRLKTV